MHEGNWLNLIPQELQLSRKRPISSMKWGKNKILHIKCRGLSDRDRIQTCNRLIRSQLLYSVELRDPIICKFSVTATGFKPVTGWSVVSYSIQLSYAAILLIQKSDRDRIQTCNRLIRSQLLYSVELRDHYFVLTGAKIRTFPELASFSTTFFVENYSMNR